MTAVTAALGSGPAQCLDCGGGFGGGSPVHFSPPGLSMLSAVWSSW